MSYCNLASSSAARRWLLLAGLGFGAIADANAGTMPTPDALRLCMSHNIPATVHIRELGMDVTDPSGSIRQTHARLTMRLEPAKIEGRPRGWMVKLRIQAPVSLSGMAYLARRSASGHGDGLFVYLPAMHRVKRVNLGLGSSPLLGSSLSYRDLEQLQTAFSQMAPLSLTATQWMSRPAYEVSYQPAVTADDDYSQIRMLVDQASCLPVQADFLSHDTIRKRLSSSAAAIRKSGRYFYLEKLEMHDLLTDIRTVLTMKKMSSDGATGRSSFEEVNFYLRD